MTDFTNYKPDHRTYGGEITLYDFEGRTTMAVAANKITKSWGFDKQCRTNSKSRERNKENGGK